MSFPRYERYKNSGVEWVGDVPEHWEVIRLKYLVQCLDGQRVPLNSSERAERPGEVPYWERTP
jgi:type I restriction enzyme S subunit